METLVQIFNESNKDMSEKSTLTAEETWKFLTKLNIASLCEDEEDVVAILPGTCAGEYQAEQSECPVCTKIKMSNPVYLPCGHLLCFSCLKKLETNANKCPLCRNQFTAAKPAFGATGENKVIICNMKVIYDQSFLGCGFSPNLRMRCERIFFDKGKGIIINLYVF